MTEPPQERVLIWDRIDANRRSTALFFVLFVLFVAAFFAAIGVFIVLYAGVPPEDQVRLVRPDRHRGGADRAGHRRR